MLTKIQVISLALCMSLSALYAEEDSERKNNFLPEYPKEAKYPSYDSPIINATRYQRLDIDNSEVNQIQKKIERTKNIINGIYDIQILQSPLIKTFKTIDTVYLHPSFIYTILLPDEYSIVDATPSFSCSLFTKKENRIRIQPEQSFNTGNIVISLNKGKEQNFTVTLVVQHYFKEVMRKEKKIKKDKKSFETRIRNIISKDSLPLVIKYVEDVDIDKSVAIEIMQIFYKIKNPKINYFLRNKDWQKIHYNRQVFYIVRDDLHGEWMLDGYKVRVVPNI